MCLEPLFLRILYLSKIFINILRFAVPILLIFKLILDIYNQVINPGEKEGMTKIGKRIIAAVIVFMVPLFVNILINFISEATDANTNSGLQQCMEFANIEYIEVLETKKYQEQLEKYNQESNDNLSKYEKIVKAVRETVKNNTNIVQTSYTIFVGDSRTEDLCQFVKLDSNEKCVAKMSQALSWFQNTAINEIDEILNSNPNHAYNIIIDLGVNSLSSPQKYANTYNELKSGKWSKHNIIITSVTPVNEPKYAKNYNRQNFNNTIKNFNNQLQESLISSIKYCDIYTPIYDIIKKNDNITSNDGLHYNSNGYKTIYQLKKACLK